MRWSATCVLVLAGCSFQASPAGAPVDAAPLDAPGTAKPDPDASSPPPGPTPFCDPTDASTVACFDFDDGTADDKSAHHLPVHAQGLAFLNGEVGLGMSFQGPSTADLDDSPVFDVSSLTMEAWVHPTDLPDDFAVVLDVDKQYALEVDSGGTVDCLLASTGATIEDGAIRAGEWTHIACTFDGTAGLATLYINGSEVDHQSATGPLLTQGTTGLSLAANNPPDAPPPPPPVHPNKKPPGDTRNRFIGMIDQVRIVSRARTAHEICLDAGGKTCL